MYEVAEKSTVCLKNYASYTADISLANRSEKLLKDMSTF